MNIQIVKISLLAICFSLISCLKQVNAIEILCQDRFVRIDPCNPGTNGWRYTGTEVNQQEKVNPFHLNTIKKTGWTYFQENTCCKIYTFTTYYVARNETNGAISVGATGAHYGPFVCGTDTKSQVVEILPNILDYKTTCVQNGIDSNLGEPNPGGPSGFFGLCNN
jgi:hypothetical protein